MTLEELLNRLEPISYDGLETVKKFQLVLEEFPELKENLIKELSQNKKWVEKASLEKVFFVINDVRWKRNKAYFPDSTALIFIGTEATPVVSITLTGKSRS